MKRLFVIVLLATSVAACTQIEVEVDNLSAIEERVIYATIENDEPTRVELNENTQTVWTKDDRIVRYGNGVYDVWTFNGETGDRGGSFSYYGRWSSTPDYDFGDKYYALYPYENHEGWGVFQDGSVAEFVNIPSEQTYHHKSYDPKSNVMLGIGRSDTDFRFRNIMGYLRLSLTGDGIVKSITLNGNNKEVLGGVRYFSLENTEIADWYSDQTYKKTIECGIGIQLTDEPTQFYFALIPTLFEKGITITITFTDGTTYLKHTSKSVNIERNTIQPMANIDTNAEVEWQTVLLQHTGARIYTPGVFDMSSSLVTFGYIYWGDDVVSKLSEAADYYTYGDGNASHTVTLKTQNATQLYLRSCAGISEIDLTNF